MSGANDPRRELAELVEAVKNEVERRRLRGGRAIDAPRFQEALARPLPAAPPPVEAPGTAPPAKRAVASVRAADGRAANAAPSVSASSAPAGTAPAAPARSAPPVPAKIASTAPAKTSRPATVKPAGAAPAASTRTAPAKSLGAADAKAAPAAAEDRGKKLPVVPVEPEPPDYAERMEALAALGREAAGCRKCGLCRTRNKVVFGTGRARTRILFIGEAPGADEDKQGYPFVGRAGKLLDQIIDAAGFRRDEVYIANILKCRPPENRNPQPPEIEACTPWLERQIQLVAPKIICALGKFAAGYLLGDAKAPMGALRGRIHYYRDTIMVVPTYHPAALLRTPSLKRSAWEDFQLLRTEYLR